MYDAPVVGRRVLDIIGRPIPSILKVELQVFQRPGLIAFDGEMVMATAPHHVVGQLALRQQGVGRHILAPDVDGLQQRPGHLDLVRAFAFFPIFIFYGQGTHFVGV